MPPPDKRCETCVHWERHNGVGCCHAHAPDAIPQCQGRTPLQHEDVMVVWPLTLSTDWCDDFKAKVP